MDLKTLSYFVTVAEELNISHAAKKLNMSQPPLSNQIKGLEEQFSQALEYTIVTEAEEATADSSAKATADEHGENSSNAESGESQHDHSSADAQEFADEIIAD